MEKFDINKEMAKLKGLNIIEKCSALDDLLDDLEDAQEQIICAKDDLLLGIFQIIKQIV